LLDAGELDHPSHASWKSLGIPLQLLTESRMLSSASALISKGRPFQESDLTAMFFCRPVLSVQKLLLQ
jgi:hypothetical protein